MKMGLILAIFLAVVCVGCVGYGEFISPAEAQKQELAQCEAKPEPEDRRICFGQVARKYGRYNAEGGYPEQWQTPNPRQ